MTPPSQQPPRIILAGGSGLIGRHLARRFREAGHDVVVLTRTANARADGVREVSWDGRTPGPWAKELDGAAAIVNLTGKSVNCRHTDENRREIIASRVDSVRAIAAAIAASTTPAPTWVQASAVGYYGNAGDRLCDESAPHGSDFMAEVCVRWEGALAEAVVPDTRRVALRFGIVLARDGGGLQVLARLARWGLGGTVASGTQYLSWIHIDDLASVVERAIARTTMAGPYNACTHTPSTNAAFMRRLRRVVHRPWSPPAPALAVKVGAWIIGTDPDVALHGQRCIPRRLDEEGFAFAHEDLGETLAGLLS